VYLIYAHWVPTHSPLTLLALSRVSDELTFLTPTALSTRTVLRGRVRVADLLATVTLETTGLFWIETISYDAALARSEDRFYLEAGRLYEKVSNILHVNLFAFRLAEAALSQRVAHIPSKDEIVHLLAGRYDEAVHAQHLAFDEQRKTFSRSIRFVAERLGDGWVLIPRLHLRASTLNQGIRAHTYLGVFLDLLDRRVSLAANVSVALYSCRAAYSFFASYCALHSIGDHQQLRESRYQETFTILNEQYREYAEIIGLYVLQAATLLATILGIGIALLALLTGLGIFNIYNDIQPDFLLSKIPTDYQPWLPPIVALLFWIFMFYIYVYILVARRIAKRILEVTNTMIEASIRP
jgi:hypothetical protein